MEYLLAIDSDEDSVMEDNGMEDNGMEDSVKKGNIATSDPTDTIVSPRVDVPNDPPPTADAATANRLKESSMNDKEVVNNREESSCKPGYGSASSVEVLKRKKKEQKNSYKKRKKSRRYSRSPSLSSSSSSSSSSFTSLSNVHRNRSSSRSNRTIKQSFTKMSNNSSSITASTTQGPTSMEPRIFMGIPTAVGYQMFPTNISFPVGAFPTGPSIGHLQLNMVDQPCTLPAPHAQVSSFQAPMSLRSNQAPHKRYGLC